MSIIAVGTRIFNIAQKYKMIDPTNKFIQKYIPPGRMRHKAFQFKEAVDFGIGGGLITNAAIDYIRGLQKGKLPPASKDGKNGNRMDGFGSGFRRRKYQQSNCYPRRKQSRNRRYY